MSENLVSLNNFDSRKC